MDIEVIDIGATYNDGTGDLLRDSFEKINENFAAMANIIAQLQAGDEFEDMDPGFMVGGVSVYDPDQKYLPGNETYVVYLSRVYKLIKLTSSTGELPNENPLVWQETSWSALYHAQNTDYKLGDHEAYILGLTSGNWSPHQQAYVGKNAFIVSTPGEGTITLSIVGISTFGITPYPFNHSFLFYVDQEDTNEYVFTETIDFNTGIGDISLRGGDYMIVRWVPFARELGQLGHFALAGTSYRQAVEGLTPLFQMTAEGLFQYMITGDAEWTTLYDITDFIPEGIQDAIDHAATDHSVTEEGGFQAGTSSEAGAGAAIGLEARTVDGENKPIDAIQLGTGVNITPRTLKVYGWTLLGADGMIPEARIPTQLSRGITRTTENEYLVVSSYMFYMANASSNNVTFVLPSAALVPNLPFIFKMSGQDSGYAMSVERSGDDVINVNGADWLGITTAVNGFWFMLVSDGSKYNLMQDSGIAAGNNMS